MMIQFSFNRFAKLARWSLTNDKKYHWKSFLQTLVILVLVFLFFTTSPNRIMVNQNSVVYQACCIATLVTFAVTIVMGSSFMFYSMTGKHDMQSLLMLPASNFEKYLMRYASWIILIPLYLVAFFAADLVQYVINMLMGHDYTTFVTTSIIDAVGDTWHKIPAKVQVGFAYGMTLTAIWLHSCYALGATLFRWPKYNWVPTTLIIILIGALIVWLTPEHSALQLDEESTGTAVAIGTMIYAVWTLLNFWLSYRLFCRQQVIGKFINI